jgi:hypothetical protein
MTWKKAPGVTSRTRTDGSWHHIRNGVSYIPERDKGSREGPSRDGNGTLTHHGDREVEVAVSPGMYACLQGGLSILHSQRQTIAQLIKTDPKKDRVALS